MNKNITITCLLLLYTLFLETTSYAQPFTKPLHIMDTLSGTTFNLNLQQGSHQFYPGINTGTYGYNRNILGPTLILKHGDSVFMNVTNNLPDTTTTHWHGLHIPAMADGGPHTPILPGQTWNPSFKVKDKAATYWYHPHLHMTTERQVARGALGLIIVRDNEEATKLLPRTYGVDDFPIVIQSKIINPINGQIVLTGPWDTVMTINGVVKPYLEVPAQPVRFRMLNGSSRRVYMLGLNDNRQYYQIATDGSLTPNPRQMNRLRLANGERSEIVIDFTGLKDSVYYLMCYGTELGQFVPGGAGGGGGMGANPYDSADYAIMKIKIIAPTTSPVAFNPSATLTTITPWNIADVDTSRLLRLTGGVGVPFSFDNAPYDHHVINQTVKLGNIEIWELRNTTFLGHPFHLHDVQFMVLDKGGLPPPLAEQGLKDVIFVDAFSTTRFITQFTNFADSTTPYMYHCHNMPHEDGGMMGQFLVLDTSLSVVMPVTQLEFTGKQQGNANVLQWRTATEQNNKGFELQHSTNGQEFSSVAFIPTQSRDGNSTHTLNYQFADKKPLSDNTYYRLKQIDFDSHSTLSNIIQIKRDKGHQLHTANIYPNPSKGSIIISTEEAQNLKVYSSVGQLILSKPIVKGTTKLTLVDKGLLFFVFEQNGHQTVRKQLMIE